MNKELGIWTFEDCALVLIERRMARASGSSAPDGSVA
jgi:hypothetical protein